MQKMLMISALAVGTLGAAADASAFDAQRSAVGPRGGSVSAQTTCTGGTCSRTVTGRTAVGGAWTRSGSAGCGGGVCSGSRTLTGPAGRTVRRHGTVSR